MNRNRQQNAGGFFGLSTAAVDKAVNYMLCYSLATAMEFAANRPPRLMTPN